ncbi:hypothetical protein Slin14017_G063100 [Septoria linicola]|nr:hypothetical protein Slin14017_G063100 [Septoria linicola]
MTTKPDQPCISAATEPSANVLTANSIVESRIQSLAQELQDLILDFTLLATMKNEEVLVSQDYRPPWQISVDSRTRKVVAPVYYGIAIFEIDRADTSYLHHML